MSDQQNITADEFLLSLLQISTTVNIFSDLLHGVP